MRHIAACGMCGSLIGAAFMFASVGLTRNVVASLIAAGFWLIAVAIERHSC
jgi:hypothetical protein